MSSDTSLNTGLWRMFAIALVLTFGFSVVLSQLVRYQVVQHEELTVRAIEQRDAERDVPPRRGTIVDANGFVLAMNLTQWDISASPSLVFYPDEAATELSALLNLPREEVYAKLMAEDPWLRLAISVPQEVGEAILDLNYSGITCEPYPLRMFTEGPLFAHVLGIVTKAGDGFYGVEGYYNPDLKGSDGKLVYERDAYGRQLPLPPEEQSQPKPGTSLILTVDRYIQYIAATELERAVEEYSAESGTVVVMDPRTGAILAITSYPTYDPNDFADTDLDVAADPSVSSLWEPGSIFKIITWSGALDAGVISPGLTVYDDGAIEVGGRIIRNWDRQGHGHVTMTDGLVQSLNTVAAYISTTMGKDRFYNYLRRFGFGSLTGVDLSSEGPGMMKLPGDSNWFPSELGTNSFGQGIAVTPMQMITAVSAVANRGLLMKPYIVQQLVNTDPETGETQITKREPMIVRAAISQEAAETMTYMLTEVIEEGATKAQVPGYRIAGKTGTAQIPTAYGYHPTDTIASFVGYAPADDPRFIVLVKLDKPTASPWGSQTAAPTFRAIAERLFVYMQIPPDEIRLALGQEGP